ncbi:MAG TPA: DUF1801 domain-containing protein [Candidatus Angelobacter sp.]|nr:DUF1801 domain-containing protein [Candidatus Angelobacter sp.]
MSGTSTNKAIYDLLESYSPEAQKLALATRALIFKVIPKTIEVVDLKARIIGYGFGTKYADMICSLMPTKAGVTLGIAWGTELPDPQNLLEGTGKVHRHVKLQSRADVDDPALKALLKAGIAHWKNKRKGKTSKGK